MPDPVLERRVDALSNVILPPAFTVGTLFATDMSPRAYTKFSIGTTSGAGTEGRSVRSE